MAVLLNARNLSKTFGSRTLFRGIDINLNDGDRLALVGPNGAGKSTLLKILAGQESPDEGETSRRKGLRVAYVSQKDTFPDGSTVRSAVVGTVVEAGLAHIHDEHEAELAAEQALYRVGFESLDAPTATLSGGQRKRLAIAREIAKEPDALFLDEPTNHLDVEGIQWLESLLRGADFASIVVTHDREFLENTGTRIAELSTQYPKGLFAVEGNYSEFLRRKQEFLDGQIKQQRSLENQVREDLRWLSRRAKARRTKSKSRIDASYARIDDLSDLRARTAARQATAIDWNATERLTRKLLVARALTKSLGGRRLFTDLDLILSPGQCLGLLGPNGSGKSTLIRVLMGDLPPDPPTPEALKEAADAVGVPPGAPAPGTIRRAESLRVVLFSQHRTEIDPAMTLAEALSPHADSVIYRGGTLHINTWSRKFLFDTWQLKQPVRSLSGGELARIHIARLMLEPADVLILDEPTNDLDIPSLEVLEESMEEFPGAIVLVTHDRAMLARLASHLVALDGRGGSRHFADYDQWEAWQKTSAREERTAKDTVPAAPDATPATPPRKKLSYMEQRELDAMEGSILAAESRVKDLEIAMNDPATLADHRRMEVACRELGEAHATVASLYERWAQLESRR
ncbi:Energy-dependent translational throttle protein EttA [Phycisphaerales bacterium]|nr:Energy-dependent translational throttle protein EttA [Phycisphaerales bacterium]